MYSEQTQANNHSLLVAFCLKLFGIVFAAVGVVYDDDDDDNENKDYDNAISGAN